VNVYSASKLIQPVQHHESGTVERNKPDRSQRPRCVISKEPRPSHDDRRRGINISGVDFWHAVEFSRNGRFLCTHPLGLSSGRFPSVLRFRLYQILFRSDPQSAGLVFAALGRSDVSNLSGFSRRFPIGPPSPHRIEFGHAEIDPVGRSCWWFGAAFAAGGVSQNRYGSAATRRTLRIGQAAVKYPLSRSFMTAPDPAPVISPGR
jgi:hypothetical protein